ncbi:hypothetical protein EVAR_7416_1 [Eumeta japonica]|uniref:Uncharacterized protein n=1 Tax=Eumeta variegata TaxID=151549 RepID=A0A4C1V8N2_EUMVA|nr:hypothetical protein EVAR_7416_1 [Eumeta japonica]
MPPSLAGGGCAYANDRPSRLSRSVDKIRPKPLRFAERVLSPEGRNVKKMSMAMMPLVFHVGATSTWLLLTALLTAKSVSIGLALLVFKIAVSAAKDQNVKDEYEERLKDSLGETKQYECLKFDELWKVTKSILVDKAKKCIEKLTSTSGDEAPSKTTVFSDESWIYTYNPESKQQSTVWVFQDEPNPTKEIRAKNTLKIDEIMKIGKAAGYDEVSSDMLRGLPPLCRHLKKGVVPSIFPWTPKPSTSAIKRQNRYMERSAKKELFPPQNPIETLTGNYSMEDRNEVSDKEENLPKYKWKLKLKHMRKKTQLAMNGKINQACEFIYPDSNFEFAFFKLSAYDR